MVNCKISHVTFKEDLIFSVSLTWQEDVELNPGPRPPKHPCGLCHRAVRAKDHAVQCDKCDQWIHTNCCNISDDSYNYLQGSNCTWICPTCDIMNFTSSFFSSSSSSVSLSNSFTPLSTDHTATSPNGNHQTRIAEGLEKSDSTSPRAVPRPFHHSSPQQRRYKPKLRCMLVNCQSIRHKQPEFEACVSLHRPDIIAGTESWLSPDINSNEIFPPNYAVYRKDRITDTRGGGVFLAVKHDIVSTPLPELDSDSESIWVKISLAQKQKSINLGAFYLPPSDDGSSLEELHESLLSLGRHAHSHDLLLMGDFNVPNINWQELQPTSPPSNHLTDKLLRLADDHNLCQLVTSPTRITPISANTLDLVFFNGSPSRAQTTVHPGISDHDIVITDLMLKPLRIKQPRRKIYLRNKADTCSIKSELLELSRSIGSNLFDAHVENKWSFFSSRIKEIIDKHLPSRFTSTRPDLPWFNRSLRRKTRKKQKLYNKAKRSGTTSDWATFRHHRKLTRSSLRSAFYKYTSDHLGSTLKEKPKAFWSYVKKLRKDNVGIPTLKTNSGLTISETQKACAFSDQFKAVFTIEDLNSIPKVDRCNLPSVSPISVTTHGVKKLLDELNPSKASGPDGIPAWFLKSYSLELAPTLKTIFQQSMDSGRVPEEWRQANVCPIFKKGKKEDPANYRPVSLTCIISKVLEHIIHSHIMKHLDAHNVLTDAQHGFRAKRSTVTQLILTIQDLTRAIQKGGQVDMAILDFAKAFDKVPHQRLLAKLESYGINGGLLQWLSVFVTQRTQTVVVNGARSDSTTVLSGVPQGTVLGPLLFLLYVNDIPESLRSTIRLFADDCLLYAQLTSTDSSTLQNDLKTLEHWQDRWQMVFNTTKCVIMHVTRAKTVSRREYNFCGKVLKSVESHPYLGIELSSDLRWNTHVNNITKKANSLLGVVKRNLWPCDRDVKCAVYKAIVRPNLEYASPSWDPYTNKCISSLDAVQRRAVRFCTNDYSRDSSATELRKTLGWQTLETRRKVSRLVIFYKIIHGLVNITCQDLLQRNRRISRNCHNYKLNLLPAYTNYYKFSFFPRTVTDWNSLPESIVNAENMTSFRERLNSHFGY